jgi:hypothetical protein
MMSKEVAKRLLKETGMDRFSKKIISKKMSCTTILTTLS